MYKLTDVALEKAASALGTSSNGGSWLTHYTEEQKRLWRTRVTMAINIKGIKNE